MLLKKNMKLRICIDFWKLNVAMKKDPYQSYEIYSFMDHEFLGYDWIMITNQVSIIMTLSFDTLTIHS
jgi:hypothetical protein